MSILKRALVPVFVILLSLEVSAQQITDISPHLRQALKQAIAQASSFPDRFDAEVWLIDMSGRIAHMVADKLERIQILRAAHAQAATHNLPVDVVLGLIETESHFNRFALSSAGAQGLMQIMPFWKLEIGRPMDNLIDIDTNIRYGCTILKHYLTRENGDMIKALARYNGSRGKTIYPNKVLAKRSRYQ
ncbi:MAG: transglycosylase SLT domain-containing protein [Oceanospirillaceae bacterium]|nr:transglycosylase SLT domain-containing protein [Oceanospirillaceae bacterium]